MSVVFVSKHLIKAGDSAASLVRDFHLSSWRAITDIPANRNCRSSLLDGEKLPKGSVISIPPNAFQLGKERLYTLHRLQPLLHRHFDALTALANDWLGNALQVAADKPSQVDGEAALAALAARTLADVESIAPQALPLVNVCVGMAETHVADDYDRKAAGTASDPLCGLYWALTPEKLNLWRNVWDIGTHRGKWAGLGAEAARQASLQYLTTIRSLIAQQLDLRIRQSMALERRLLAEQAQG